MSGETEKVRLDFNGYVFFVFPGAVQPLLFFGELGRDATEVGLMLFHMIQAHLVARAAANRSQ